MSVAADLRALVRRFALPADAESAFARYLDLLATDPTAPTTVTDPAQAVNAHLADALVALDLPELSGPVRCADLGSGAGVPGLPLAIARPDIHVSLVDSLERKGAFLRRAVEVAGVTNADVVVTRAESWPGGLARHDVVLARAVAPLTVLLEYAAPLLREGGHLVAWKGRPDEHEEADAAAAADVLAMRLDERRPVTPWSGAERRSLYVARKIGPTPPGYPRRPGMARKRPLGAPRGAG